MSCRIQNDSTAPIPQVLFPDLSGLQQVDDIDRVQLRFALGWVSPFAGPVDSPDRARFYAPLMWQEYEAECGYHLNALRWLDYGSLRGGLSVFQKQWGTGSPPNVHTHRSEANPDVLRLAWSVPATVEPGTSWESEEFWLTPHLGGWAKGIEVYRDYVNHVNPPRELPPVVRDGVGFQTIWMTQSTEPDGDKAAFRYKDIARVAQDAHEHGIDELMLWNWAKYGSPELQFRPDLGTREELLEGIRAANQIGVKVVPFINVVNLDDRFAARYGMKPGGAAPWTYHPEMIPAMVPFSNASGQIAMDTRNQRWHEDVLRNLTKWADLGMSSFGWDVFDDNGSLSLVRLIEEVRKQTRSRDQDSIFAGEPCQQGSLERDNLVLDHTWNWLDYIDAGPLVSVLRTPRFNCNVQNSPRVVKMAFAEGLYINLMPKKPDQPNDTALISEEPALSVAIKEVAALRKQFLPFFVEGTALGESILAEPASLFDQKPICTGSWTGCTGGWVGGATQELGEFKYPGVFVRAHRLQERLLILVLNNEDKPKEIVIKSDLRFWLPSKGGYQITYHDFTGKLIATTNFNSSDGPLWLGKTRLLRPTELSLFEIRALSV
jgi:hypothetical protein